MTKTNSRIRTLSSLRRNGWNRPTLVSAVDTLKALLPAESATTSSNEELARELLRWLDVAPDEFLDSSDSWARTLPAVSGPLEKVCEILEGAEETMLTNLREAFPNPTAVLVEFINDLDENERNSDTGIFVPVASAIVMLGELSTSESIRCLISCLDWRSESVDNLVRAALAKTIGLVEVVVEIWPAIGGFARAVLVEEMVRGGLRDERIFVLLSDWAIESTEEDLMWCVFALGDYLGSRAVPPLLHLLDRALLHQEYEPAREVILKLSDLGVEPTPEQLASFIRIWPESSLFATPGGLLH